MSQKKNKPAGTDAAPDRKSERIAKVLARAGVASRRGVERMIEEGRIAVDGKVLDTPATLVTTTSGITVDGQPVDEAEPTRVWLYHKPVGLIVSHGDPQGRETVFDVLPKDMPRVISVGRLDINSEGLLLLTNHGGLAQYLEKPSTGWKRHYRVRGHGRPDSKRMEQIRKGATVDGIRYGAVDLEEEESAGRSNRWYALVLREGKNREVRRLMEFAGVQVNRLLRTSFGPFQLGKLPAGAVREVPRAMLRQQLGKKAAEFGLT